MQPLVSIVMPAYNAEKYIEKAISSVLDQTYENWQLIIIDDNSTDQTRYIVSKYSFDDRIIVHQNSATVGIARARNIGLGYVTGDWIAFLDSDDYWAPNKIENQLSIPDLDNFSVLHGNYCEVDKDGKWIREIIAPKILSFEMLIKHNYIGNLTGMYNKNSLGLVEFENLNHEDYNLWLTLLRETHSCRPDGYLAFNRKHGNNFTKNKLKSLYWHFQVLRHQKVGNLIRVILYTLQHIFIKIKNY